MYTAIVHTLNIDEANWHFYFTRWVINCTYIRTPHIREANALPANLNQTNAITELLKALPSAVDKGKIVNGDW
jgi:hypothetical protein